MHTLFFLLFYGDKLIAVRNNVIGSAPNLAEHYKTYFRRSKTLIIPVPTMYITLLRQHWKYFTLPIPERFWKQLQISQAELYTIVQAERNYNIVIYNFNNIG
ncbi:Uncharacterized protein BM_BM1628 [Brugia malayi]|uniref:Bm1628 n=1 Tax=Brugia malayi TaxID=6279 RepID=A0A0J9Y4J6_BRUMA|nr:Uncharacterized protein BM_BM1628 [Brugia malayi]CDQ02216.1 Bm1628 [Brugia malayi]VIO96291.1 Uncharacterized protein BM_BM1628 [Brugia malayi]